MFIQSEPSATPMRDPCPQGRGRAKVWRLVFFDCSVFLFLVLFSHRVSADSLAEIYSYIRSIYSAIESIFLVLWWSGLFVAWSLGFHKGGQR